MPIVLNVTNNFNFTKKWIQISADLFTSLNVWLRFLRAKKIDHFFFILTFFFFFPSFSSNFCSGASDFAWGSPIKNKNKNKNEFVSKVKNYSKKVSKTTKFTVVWAINMPKIRLFLFLFLFLRHKHIHTHTLTHKI